MYDYKATLERVIDGDTVVLNLDLGFYVTHQVHCRLAHINAPERGTPGADAATTWATQLLTNATSITATTYKVADKYGRWLAVIFVDGVNMNERAVELGYAVPYEGGTR